MMIMTEALIDCRCTNVVSFPSWPIPQFSMQSNSTVDRVLAFMLQNVRILDGRF